MKLLKAQQQSPKTISLAINDIQYKTNYTEPLVELINGEELIYPIEVIKHHVISEPRYGANGVLYKEKQYSVFKGNQRIVAALKLGYSHIDAEVINE